MSALNLQSTATMQRPRSRWFFTGENGSSKTTIASTFPDPLFLVYKGENSMETLRAKGGNFPFIEISPGDVMKQLNAVFNELLATQKTDPNELPCETLVWDSLSHFNGGIIDELSDNGKKEMDFRQWGILKNFYAHAQQMLWQLDMNIVLTSYPAIKLDAKQNIISAGPAISGSSAKDLPGACDHHGYCDVIPGDGTAKRPDVFKVYFRKTGGYPARTRSTKLPREIQNFNYQEIEKFLA